MVLKRILHLSFKYCKREYGINVKPKIEADQNVLTNIKNEIFKPKQHPGIIKLKTVSLPPQILQAMENILQDYPIKGLSTDADALARHLKNRVPPMEAEKLKEIKQQITKRVLKKESHVEITNEVDAHQFQQKVKDKVENILKEKVYHWSPLNYNIYNSLLYLVARTAPEYAVMVKIFSEINIRDPDFKPRSLFDFGSGVGTVTWAARLYWKNHIFENYNVDISSDMNDLAQTILQGGSNNTGNNLKGVSYRQFLPATNVTYDIVVSAYSMLELPSFQTRMNTVLQLWNKTNKYLVIVEYGTNAGFRVINEIRDFLLHLKGDKNSLHVFSPCPHDSPCPRFLINDHTPCNFEIKYIKPLVKSIKSETERYSYIVLKRGSRNSEDEEWPRIVRETLVRSKHTICRMCTSNGSLEEVIFTASKHGKSMYHCARASKWGDRVPITLKNSSDNDT